MDDDMGQDPGQMAQNLPKGDLTNLVIILQHLVKYLIKINSILKEIDKVKANDPPDEPPDADGNGTDGHEDAKDQDEDVKIDKINKLNKLNQEELKLIDRLKMWWNNYQMEVNGCGLDVDNLMDTKFIKLNLHFETDNLANDDDENHQSNDDEITMTRRTTPKRRTRKQRTPRSIQSNPRQIQIQKQRNNKENKIRDQKMAQQFGGTRVNEVEDRSDDDRSDGGADGGSDGSDDEMYKASSSKRGRPPSGGTKRKRIRYFNYKCTWENCDKAYAQKDHLRVHLMSHTGEYPFVCPFELCKAKFRQEKPFLIHQQRYHLNIRPFKCNQCTKDFTLERDLASHLETHKLVKLKCEWPGCDKAYTTKGQLLIHQKKMHTGELIQCFWPGCDEKFATKHDLSVHACIHTNEGKYKCSWPECGRAFGLKRLLIRHQAHHSDSVKSQACEWPGCEMKFVSTHELERHRMVHSQQKKFVCDWPGCSFKTSWPSCIASHRRTHTGEKPYVCTFPNCNKTFAQTSNLKKHKLVHIGEKWKKQEGQVKRVFKHI